MGRCGSEGITDAEMNVLLLILEPISNAEIAKRLFVAEKTVRYHLSAIYQKLGIPNNGRCGRKKRSEAIFKIHNRHISDELYFEMCRRRNQKEQESREAMIAKKRAEEIKRLEEEDEKLGLPEGLERF